MHATEHSDIAVHFCTFIKGHRQLWSLQSKGFTKPHEKSAFVDDDVDDFVQKFIQTHEQFVEDSVISPPINRIRSRVNLAQGTGNCGFENDVNENDEDPHASMSIKEIGASSYGQVNVQSQQRPVERQDLVDFANYRNPQDIRKVTSGPSRGTRRAAGSQAKVSQQTKKVPGKVDFSKSTYPVPDPQESDKVDIALAKKLSPDQQYFCRRRFGPNKARCGQNHKIRLCSNVASVKLEQAPVPQQNVFDQF